MVITQMKNAVARVESEWEVGRKRRRPSKKNSQRDCGPEDGRESEKETEASDTVKKKEKTLEG